MMLTADSSSAGTLRKRDLAASGVPGSTLWYQLLSAPPARRVKGRRFLLAAGLAVLLVALNLYSPAEPTLMQRLLASMIVIAAAVPLFVWQGRRQPETPFLVFFGLVYALYYAAPVFLLERFSRGYYIAAIIPTDAIEHALGYALLGILALMVGYYGPFRRALNRFVPRFRLNWECDRQPGATLGMTLGVLGLTAYLLVTAVPLPLSVKGFADFLADLSVLAVIYLFLLQLVGVRRGMLFLWGLLVPLRFLLGITTGATYQGLVVLGAVTLTYATVRRRLPVAWLMVGVVAFFAIRAAQIPFREKTWEDGVHTMGIIDRTAIMFRILTESLSEPSFLNHAWQVGTSRTSHLMTFAEVVRITPDDVPFWRGETYVPLVWKLVPRAIFPEKPLEIFGQEFGHRYGFLSPDDFITSYNLPQLVEFYANFGIGGVALGMLLLGIFYRLVQVALVHPRSGLGAIVAAIYIGLKLLLIESNLSLVVGGVLQAALFLGVVHFCREIFFGHRRLQRVSGY